MPPLAEQEVQRKGSQGILTHRNWVLQRDNPGGCERGEWAGRVESDGPPLPPLLASSCPHAVLRPRALELALGAAGLGPLAAEAPVSPLFLSISAGAASLLLLLPERAAS